MSEAPKQIELLPDIAVQDVQPGDLRLYGVTSIIGVLDKPALLWWAAEQTAEAACDQADYLSKRIQTEGREKVVRDLGKARFERKPGILTATELGTGVHDGLEQLAFTGQFPKDLHPEVVPFIEQADRWMQKFQPTYLAAEMAVFNKTYNYAGTLDFIFEIDGVKFLGDIKTTRKSVDSRGKPTKPYPEQVGLQLAAYRYAELAATWRARRYEKFSRRYYLLGQEEESWAKPVPEVDACLVLHITPEHCEGFPIRADEEAFAAFLYALECFRWVNDTSKRILGEPLRK